MHYIELTIVDGPSICLPIGSFSFSTSPHGGGSIIETGTGRLMHVDQSYEYIIDSMNTRANIWIIRAPEYED